MQIKLKDRLIVTNRQESLRTRVIKNWLKFNALMPQRDLAIVVALAATAASGGFNSITELGNTRFSTEEISLAVTKANAQHERYGLASYATGTNIVDLWDSIRDCALALIKDLIIGYSYVHNGPESISSFVRDNIVEIGGDTEVIVARYQDVPLTIIGEADLREIRDFLNLAIGIFDTQQFRENLKQYRLIVAAGQANKHKDFYREYCRLSNIYYDDLQKLVAASGLNSGNLLLKVFVRRMLPMLEIGK